MDRAGEGDLESDFLALLCSGLARSEVSRGDCCVDTGGPAPSSPDVLLVTLVTTVTSSLVRGG